jgi:hypothetical protein
MGFPEGLGFNELSEILKEQMAPPTLGKKLKDLKSYGFIKQVPKKSRRGQKTTLYLSKAYKEYGFFLERLDNETNSLIKQFEVMKIENETDAKALFLITNHLIKQYSMPFLADSVLSWDPNWIYNEKIMKEILFIVYVSFIRVKEKMDIIIKNPEYKKYIDEFTKKQLEKLNKLEEKNLINTTLFDDVNLFTLRLYKNSIPQRKEKK